MEESRREVLDMISSKPSSRAILLLNIMPRSRLPKVSQMRTLGGCSILLLAFCTKTIWDMRIFADGVRALGKSQPTGAPQRLESLAYLGLLGPQDPLDAVQQLLRAKRLEDIVIYFGNFE